MNTQRRQTTFRKAHKPYTLYLDILFFELLEFKDDFQVVSWFPCLLGHLQNILSKPDNTGLLSPDWPPPRNYLACIARVAARYKFNPLSDVISSNHFFANNLTDNFSRARKMSGSRGAALTFREKLTRTLSRWFLHTSWSGRRCPCKCKKSNF